MTVRQGYPDFLDLPWGHSLENWGEHTSRLEEVSRGLSRHPVVFVNYDGRLFAFKELPGETAELEYDMLSRIEELRIPCVSPVGQARTRTDQGDFSVLITRYLDHSLPIRDLFASSGLVSYRIHLLDAIAGLLVQLHLAGVYWGDCSLSNTLFRRDAGALRAYMVDAETAEIYFDGIPPAIRHHDLTIMEENINADLGELNIGEQLVAGILTEDTGAHIRVRYQRLWEEITREDIIAPGEHFRIQERIRALNKLGFSVGDVELWSGDDGAQLRLRVFVTDRSFHRDQLQNLTGLDVEERQAQKMMNEILELRATLTQENNRSTPLSVAAYHWLKNIYEPVITQLAPLINHKADSAELYCQLLEHKWYLSEKAHRDVGHKGAAEDYMKNFANRTV